MYSLQEQKNRYETLWKNFEPLFGSEIMEDDPEPLYHIGISLSEKIYEEMDQVSAVLHRNFPAHHQWLKPSEMHITLDLSGRLGKHFQKSDIECMKEWLIEICENQKPFSVELANINYFPQVLYREVLSPDQKLYHLHNAIAQRIPWSQHPEYRFENYIPHMSLVYLKYLEESLIEKLDINRTLPSLSMDVSCIYFAVSSDITQTEQISLIELGSGKLL